MQRTVLQFLGVQIDCQVWVVQDLQTLEPPNNVGGAEGQREPLSIAFVNPVLSGAEGGGSQKR